MARRIAMAMVLVAGGCSSSDADVKGAEPAAEHLGVNSTTTPPTTVPPSTVPPSTTTTAPAVEVSSGRTSTSVAHPPTSASTAPPPETTPAAGAVSAGKASWYARGARTANGEAFEPDGFTAAHRTLAFGTRLNVCHDGRCVEVRINDRGPALWTGRVIDLSRGAFAAIAPLGAGVVDVTWTEAA